MSELALSRWQAASWRLIAEHAELPAVHAALDETLLVAVQRGERPPTLRFWAWSAPAVIIGRFQSYRNEVDPDAAARLGVTIVRRVSGGGAMFVQPGCTITYSLYMPDSLLEGITLRDSYEFCDRWVVETFRTLGADVVYVPLNDIASPLGKVGGAAQARRPGVVLHHTTIAYRMDPNEMVSVLRIGREKLSDKGIPSAAKRVHPLGEQLTQSRSEIVATLLDQFRQRFGGEADSVTEAERAEAERLVLSRYGTESWTLELP